MKSLHGLAGLDDIITRLGFFKANLFRKRMRREDGCALGFVARN